MLRLEELRKNKGLSQIQLAEKLNMTQQRISAYEKGIREPDIETIKQFASFFGVSIDYLLGKSDTQKHEISDFSFAYHKETEGLSEEDILDAIKAYKEIIKKFKKNNGDKK